MQKKSKGRPFGLKKVFGFIYHQETSKNQTKKLCEILKNYSKSREVSKNPMGDFFGKKRFFIIYQKKQMGDLLGKLTFSLKSRTVAKTTLKFLLNPNKCVEMRISGPYQSI